MFSIPRYDLVLLDADGTLFDFDQAESIALERAFLQHGFPYDPDVLPDYRRFNRAAWDEFEQGLIDKAALQSRRFEQLLQYRGLGADGGQFNQSYMGFLGECSQLLPGAVEVCRALAPHCTLAIASNGIQATQARRLAGSAIAPYISHLIVSETAGFGKPHPGFYAYAFEVCGQQDKSRAIMVGDSLAADIAGGIAFGIATCWYNPLGLTGGQDKQIDYQIRDLAELPQIVL